MSLLDRGPETVTVQRRKRQQDQIGGSKWINDGDPIPVKGVMVQPVSAAVLTDMGLEVIESKRVIGRRPGGWPGGPYSLITWRGRDWTQPQGVAMEYDTSPGVAHFSIIIQSTDVEAG